VLAAIDEMIREKRGGLGAAEINAVMTQRNRIAKLLGLPRKKVAEI
jgi:hypothetical protein